MKAITIAGRVTKDSEIRQTTKGEFVTFSVACGDGYGENKKTIYFECSYYQTKLAQYLKKGKEVVVSGDFGTRVWTNPETNAERTYLQIRASNVSLMGNTPRSGEVQYNNFDNFELESDQKDKAFNDEIPF